jgi:hypothetical protein
MGATKQIRREEAEVASVGRPWRRRIRWGGHGGGGSAEAMGSAVVVSTAAVGVVAMAAGATDWQVSVPAIMAAITATDMAPTAAGILTAMPATMAMMGATAAATWLGSA